jgi:hypothetical protein
MSTIRETKLKAYWASSLILLGRGAIFSKYVLEVAAMVEVVEGIEFGFLSDFL